MKILSLKNRINGANGKFELWRRLLLLFCCMLAIWLYMYVSVSPLVRIDLIDFSREQARETEGYFVTEEKKHLASLPLEDYIVRVTDGEILNMENFADSELEKKMRNAYAGNPEKNLEKRIQKHELGRRSIRSLFYRPHEEPVVNILSKTGIINDPVYLKWPGSSYETMYLQMNYMTFPSGTFKAGYGYMGVYEPPVQLFRPARSFSLWIFMIGLIIYIVIPRPRRSLERMSYSDTTAVLGDVVGLILSLTFFALPILITGGSVQALEGFLAGTLLFWSLSLICLWLFFMSAWYASFGIYIDDNEMVLSHYGGEDKISLNNIESYQPAEKRYPRWMVVLLALSTLFSGGTQQIGGSAQTVFAATASSRGIRIHQQNGSNFDIWMTGFAGNQLLKNSRKLVEKLDKAGIKKVEETVIDYSFSLSNQNMGKKGKRKEIFKATVSFLALFFVVIMVSFYYTN